MVNSVGYVLRFLTKLCRSLLCDNLFSHLPYPGSLGASEKTQEREDGRTESGEVDLLLPAAGALPHGWQMRQLLRSVAVLWRPRPISLGSQEDSRLTGTQVSRLFPSYTPGKHGLSSS